jgi:hypothetical protein
MVLGAHGETFDSWIEREPLEIARDNSTPLHSSRKP